MYTTLAAAIVLTAATYFHSNGNILHTVIAAVVGLILGILIDLFIGYNRCTRVKNPGLEGAQKALWGAESKQRRADKR